MTRTNSLPPRTSLNWGHTEPNIEAMKHFVQSDKKTAALTQELHDIVENDRYPFSPRVQTLSRQSRNQTGGRRQNSSSAVRAILDDPPIHIRPRCSRKRASRRPRTLWVQRFSARPWLHSSATPATRFFARVAASQLVSS